MVGDAVVGQVQGPRDAFISAITTSQGAYENPLLIAISTQAPTDADMFSVWLDAQKNAPDPRVVSHVYAAPEDCAPSTFLMDGCVFSGTASSPVTRQRIASPSAAPS